MKQHTQMKTSASYFLMLALLLATVFGCKKEKINPVSFADDINTSVRAKAQEPLELKPQMTGTATAYEWLEDGKVVGTQSSYIFTKQDRGDYELTFKATNKAGTTTLTYKIKVVGKYADGILLVSNTNANGNAADISYLDEKEKLTPNVFSLENNGTKLPLNTMSAFRYSNQLYITSSGTPNVQVVDDETLKLANIEISNSSVRSITYFATTDGKTGYVVGGTGSRRGLYAVDLTAKTIAGTLLTGTASAALIPIKTYNNAYLTPVLKKLVSVKDGVLQTLFTYPENIAGIVKTSNKQVWMGISKGSSANAKMVRLNENLEVQETIDLPSELLLNQNGEMISADGINEFIYWQETETGEIYRFNATTKKTELFAYPSKNDGAGFLTAWKVHPRTGELYVIDAKSTSDSLPSDLLIYSLDKKLRKKIANVGYQVKDVVFPK
ncbi:DUF5074 domain-containing protein [Pedobacter nanyangensis]|uniref:DUF5074 domain-containing protein n=1 Tax=Pedobacter nanyangensis TaxID=1562389 RepID=UPI000DE1F6B8|nr:DUF5074 domain-containing protein [Pedobacter nanyangensis]